MLYFKRLVFVSVVGLAISLGAISGSPQEKKFPIDPIKPPVVKLDRIQVAELLQNTSVTIKTGDEENGFHYGTGVIKTRDGTHYVLTCAHVVSSCKTDDGFDNAEIITDLYEDSRIVGQNKLEAEVISYSEKEDLAVLRILKKDAFKNSVKFSKDKKAVPVGTELFHVGSFKGMGGSTSFSTGVVSKHGRVRSGVVFDQSSCTCFPGSSGGGVFNTNGEYVGMIVRAGGETFNLYVPMRRIYEWADKAGMMFIFDDEVAVPENVSLTNPEFVIGFAQADFLLFNSDR